MKLLLVACSDIHAVCFHAIATALERLGHAVDIVAVFPKAENYLASAGREAIACRRPLKRLTRCADPCDDLALNALAAYEMRVSRGRIKGTIARVVSALRKYWKGVLTGGDYDRVVVNNGAGSLHRVLEEQARALPRPPKIWYTEAGFFPNTMVIDPQGVNRHSTLMDLAVEELPPAAPDIDGFLAQWREGRFPRAARGIHHSIWSHLRSLDMLHPVTCALLGRSPWEQLAVTVSARCARRPSARQSSPVAARPYVFVPLQVHDDTQVLLNSQHFHDMRSLVAHIVRHVPGHLSVIVKPHPADRGRVAMDDVRRALSPLGDRGIWEEQTRSTELVAYAEAVVTLNSTVGLEAITFLRPTCCLGHAWYAKPGLARSLADPDGLSQWLLSPTRPDLGVVRRLVSFLIRDYLLPGGFNGMTLKQAERAAQRILDEDLPWPAGRRSPRARAAA